MKKINIIITIILMFLVNNTFAQQHNPPQAGDNFIDPSLNKFIGTWVWSNATDTVKFVLKKENFQFNGYNYSADRIVGFHSYKKADVLIESTLAYQNTGYLANHSSILAGSDKNNNYNLIGTIHDISKNKYSIIQLKLNSTQNQLQLSLKERAGLRVNIDSNNFDVYTLPNNITLTKQP